MKTLAIVLFALSMPVLAGGLIPGLPGNGGIGVGVTTDTNSGAYAGNAGNNSQNIIFRNGQPGTQRQIIESTPALGSMYTPMTSDCYIAASAQGVALSAGAGATVPILALPCHFRNLGKDAASIGVAMYNTGTPEAQQEGREVVTDGIDMIECTDVNMYLIRKAKGRRPCPVMPDRGVSDVFAGGMVGQHVIPNPAYAKQVPPTVAYQPMPEQHYPDPNTALDQGFQEQMKK